MTHRHAKLAAAAVAIALAATACNRDDDSSDDTTTVPPDTTASPTTDPPPTTEPPTTSSSTTSTTGVTTTTLDIEALKAQIAEDYIATEQALEDLNRNPTLENLEARVAAIAVPGSYVYDSVLQFVQGMVERGERVAPGSPDYSDVLVEAVDLPDGPAAGTAEVTACIVSNQARVGPGEAPVAAAHTLYAARVRQPMTRTESGWRQSEEGTRVSIQEGATSCAP